LEFGLSDYSNGLGYPKGVIPGWEFTNFLLKGLGIEVPKKIYPKGCPNFGRDTTTKKEIFKNYISLSSLGCSGSVGGVGGGKKGSFSRGYR